MTDTPAALSPSGDETRRESGEVRERLLEALRQIASIPTTGPACSVSITPPEARQLLAALAGERPAPGAMRALSSRLRADAIGWALDEDEDREDDEDIQVPIGSLRSTVALLREGAEALSGAAPVQPEPQGLEVAQLDPRTGHVRPRGLAGDAPQHCDGITHRLAQFGVLVVCLGCGKAWAERRDAPQQEPVTPYGWLTEKRVNGVWSFACFSTIKPVPAEDRRTTLIYPPPVTQATPSVCSLHNHEYIDGCPRCEASQALAVTQAAPLSVKVVARKVVRWYANPDEDEFAGELARVEALIARALPQQGEVVERLKAAIQEVEETAALARVPLAPGFGELLAECEAIARRALAASEPSPETDDAAL